MHNTHLDIITFSPTGGSACIANEVARGMEVGNIKTWNITKEIPTEQVCMGQGPVIVSAPVYGGRIPGIALERLQKFNGERTPAIVLVTYGNRDYEDALKELCDVLTQQGFVPLAAGAFIAEHSYSTQEMPIAQGRPDEADKETARRFGAQVITTWRKKEEAKYNLSEIQVKGSFPYKVKGAHTPQAPSIDQERWTLCGACLDVCPTHAISLIDDQNIFSDQALCIKCCACVKSCPEEARSFETPFRKYLFENFAVRKEPEFFL
jgi:ferredoxin